MIRVPFFLLFGFNKAIPKKRAKGPYSGKVYKNSILGFEVKSFGRGVRF